MSSERLFRLSVISCALEWCLFGLLLGDTLRASSADRHPTPATLATLVLVAVLGAGTVASLLRAPRRTTRAVGPGAPAA